MINRYEDGNAITLIEDICLCLALMYDYVQYHGAPPSQWRFDADMGDAPMIAWRIWISNKKFGAWCRKYKGITTE